MLRRAACLVSLAIIVGGASGVAQAAELARCQGARGYAATGTAAGTLLWRPEWLAAQKVAHARDTAQAASLRRAAEAALRREPYSVRHKTAASPSGDPADYVSIGPYWWPNPETADGIPYVRRDGQTNPERNGNRFDSRRLEAMADDVMLLALAGHHLGERSYANHAAHLVRTWFLDPSTRMNPHLVYAQAVPGRSTGRSFGIIDAVRLIEVAEAVALLEAQGALSVAETAAVRRWFGDLASWMETSEAGQAAAATLNNHSLYFDLMLAHFSLFAGKEEVAAKISGAYAARRLAHQLDPSGSMPHELARSRPWTYSVFALKAALQMAMLGECVGVDLWNWRTADGRSLRGAVDYLVAFRSNDLAGWTSADLDLDDPASREKAMQGADQLFRVAAWGWQDPALGSGGEGDYLIPVYRP